MSFSIVFVKLRKILLALACAAVVAGCAGLQKQSADSVPEVMPGFLAGYLQPEALPDSLALLPAPPAQGSAARAQDEAVSREALTLRGSSRWTLATQDAELRFPEAAGTFSCALGVPISEKETPHLYMLLRRSLTDAGLSTYNAKKNYRRVRPFMENKAPTCTPDEEKHLAKDGSFPSGHTAVGWAWALVLAEIAPDRADAILARGRAFGESRIICNVHWQSDVVEGRFMGAATVARLHGDPAFQRDLAAAKAEYQVIHGKGLKPIGDCKAEAEVLGQHSLRIQ